MPELVTLEQVEVLVAQLAPQEQLKLVAHVSERLSSTLAVVSQGASQEESWVRAERLRLATSLLEEVEDIADDSQGEFDAAETLQRLRDERIAQLCRSDV